MRGTVAKRLRKGVKKLADIHNDGDWKRAYKKAKQLYKQQKNSSN